MTAKFTVVDIEQGKTYDWKMERSSLTETLNDVLKMPIVGLNREKLSERLTKHIVEQKTAELKEHREKEAKNDESQKKKWTDGTWDQRVEEDKSEIQKAKDNFMNDETFKGTYHCQTTIMAALVMRALPGVSDTPTDDLLTCNGIFAMKKHDLLAMLKDPLPLVCLSKRCCPA